MKRIFILLSFFCLTGVANTLFAQEVKINTNFVVESDGTLLLKGDATVWDDIMIPGFSAKSGDNPPVMAPFLGNTVINYFTDASKAGNEIQVYFTVQFPHSWAGTAIHPHIHWSPKTNPGTETSLNEGIGNWLNGICLSASSNIEI